MRWGMIAVVFVIGYITARYWAVPGQKLGLP